jgi:hypothetical protein
MPYWKIFQTKKLIVGDGHAVDTGYTKNIIANSPLKEGNKHGINLVGLHKRKMKKWKEGYTEHGIF